MRTHVYRAFTLIELLVVIALIGLLASIVLVALNGARSSARNATSRADLRELQTALEAYYNDNSGYPVTCTTTCGLIAGSNAWGVNSNFGSHASSGSNGWIPGLAPTYVAVLPVDPNPALNSFGYNFGFVYESNGTDYMILDYGGVEGCTWSGTTGDPMTRPYIPTQCDYAVYTSGASQW